MTDAPAPEAEPTALVIDLSGEELSYLLGMLNVREIPGFVPDTAMDDLIQSVVRHSLAARGAIARDIDGTWLVSDLVNAAVTAGVRASRYLSVRRDTSAGSAEDWLYVLPRVVVQYGQPDEYIHRFQAMFTAEGLVESIIGLLELAAPDPRLDGVNMTLPATVLDVRRLAREGRIAEAHRAADAHGIPDDLRAALIAPAHYAALSGVAVAADRAAVTGGMAVASARDGEYWILTPVGSAIHASLGDSSAVVRRVADVLQP